MQKLLDLLPLNGNKTYLGALGLLAVGIGGIVLKIVEPSSEYGLSVEQGLQLILAGIAAFGIGHKIDKISSANNPTDKIKKK